ncbi:Mechanosensitive ion channel-domain-containing protein [Suillus paluster]|uniref:Mechanosensitive ion channel-domain-containing protein n=1 Tax=Suillus paluster TaxID=48578 RepID=UPI001B85E000|nr:Mechanosensitive ion channel-domain-containing protein [Suillus paluster]KAG1753685.1 Mechanosensitive ion channel-domain-containing protein [Suillus paluster]
MRDRLHPPPSFAPHDPLFTSDDNSEENHLVNSTPSSLYPPDQSTSTSQLVLDRYPSQESIAYRSQANLMSSYEKDVDWRQKSRQESGNSHPSEAGAGTQTGTQKPSVHYHEDVNSPPATGSYFNGFPKSDSRQSSEDEDEEDEFDWSGDEDLDNEEAKFEKKMGVKIKPRSWGIIRLVTLLFSSLIGSTFLAAVLATPALLVHFFWYKPHPTDYRHYVDINIEAWLFWAAANVVISWALAMIIDIVPAIIRVVIAVTWGHVSESVKTKLELYASIKDTIKPLFYAASAWLSWTILFQNIFALHDSSGVQSYASYTDRVAQVIEFLFFFTLVICIQRMLSHAVAFAFHRTAYKERLDEVRKALQVIEKLRNYKPKSSSRHKSNHTPMFATLSGLMPFSEKEHFNLLSSRLRSESSVPSENDDADMEDGAAKAKKRKGKGKHRQRNTATFIASEDLESYGTTPEPVGSVATTPATHSPVDKHTTHKYPPTPAGQRSVYPHNDDPTIVVQAAKAFKTAVLHDARNIKGADDELEALVFSVGSAHEAKRLARAIYRTFRDRRRTYLVPSDFYPAFATRDEAKEAFRVFDKDNNGDISRPEIKSELLRVYKERRFLSRSMHDVSAALKTLDQILLLFALVILFFISLSIFGVNVTQSLTSVYSLGLAVSFIFKNSASNVFDAIMFLFVTHPFDTGDRCFIDNENLVVKKMGLFATVFTRSDGTETYYFNSQLFTKFITNVRRSDKMAESCTIQVTWRTPQEKLDALEQRLNTWLSTEENRWFQPTTSVVLQNISYQRYLECTIGISHNSTWQDWSLRNARRTAFHAAVQHYCRELGITAYEAPMPIAYADAGMQRYDIPQEAVVSDVRSPDSPHSPDAATKSFLGFTPPRDQSVRLARHLTRMRRSKSRKAAVRGVGADGGGNG